MYKDSANASVMGSGSITSRAADQSAVFGAGTPDDFGDPGITAVALNLHTFLGTLNCAKRVHKANLTRSGLSCMYDPFTS